MIGPYSTPSSHKIMPSMVAPETAGFEVAVTVKPGLTAAPAPGELTVMMSFVDGAGVLVAVRAAVASPTPRMLRTKHTTMSFTETLVGKTFED
jgi:hypothetical protein